MARFPASQILFFLAVVCTNPAWMAATAQAGLDDMLPEKSCLVSASVEEIKKEHGQVANRLRINHIYFGKAKAGQRTFVYYSSEISDGSGNVNILPSLEVGEEMLWLLDRRPDGSLRVATHSRLGVSWPVRRKFSARYTHVKALAEAIEKLSGTSADARLQLLVGFAGTKIPEVVTWAVKQIAADRPKNLDAILEDLLKSPGLTTAGLVAIDEVLAEVRGNQWSQSQRRISLFAERLKKQLSQHEADALLARMDTAEQLGQFDHKRLSELLELMIGNDRIPLSARRQCLFLVGRVCKRSKRRSEWFSLLVSVIMDSQNLELRYAAAHSIKNAGSLLSEDQKDTLEQIRKRAKDAKLVAVLVKVIKESQEKTHNRD